MWRLHQHLQHVQRASTLNPTTDFNKRKRRNVCPEWKKITAEYFGEITAYMVICTVGKALEHRNPNLICRAKPPYWKMHTGSGVVSVEEEGSSSNYYVFCEPLISEKLMEALDRASHWSRGTLTAVYTRDSRVFVMWRETCVQDLMLLSMPDKKIRSTFNSQIHAHLIKCINDLLFIAVLFDEPPHQQNSTH